MERNHKVADMSGERSLAELMRRLCDLSIEHAYDPHTVFDWPESLPESVMWMSRDLLSVHDTPYIAQLSAQQLCNLSRWELVNFFSFNVHGIRDLMLHVLSCIHNEGYEETSEYFHHFLDEENKHMWFFAEFCRRYGGKVYITQKLQFPMFEEEDIQAFLAFSKILISEQIGDFYNVRMMNDPTLPAIVQKINRVHHDDESRHISMGRRIVGQMYEGISRKYPPETMRRVESYVRRYMDFFIQSFYNPGAYRDAGIGDPYEWRRHLIKDPARQRFHEQALRSSLQFFKGRALFADESDAARQPA
jgi:P-aminobenzoate N-oxygenase AurF